MNLLQAARNFRARLRRRAWLRKQKSIASIDPSLQFKGHPFGERFVSIEQAAILERLCQIWISPDADHQPGIKIGKKVFIGQGCILSSASLLEIGDHCLIGAYSYILTNNHRFQTRDIPISEQGHTTATVHLESDVWLGTHCTILPGVTIGKGAVVASGSVVNCSIPSYEIWGGVPAKKLKDRP